MANIKPISKEHYSEKRWQRPSGLHFAAGDVVCRLSAHELIQAVLSLPVAFMCRDDKYYLVSVQGLEQGQNLFVTADGRWINRYVPVAYRYYPFLLVNTDSDDGQKVLCIDEDSGLVVDGDEGELFFAEDGEPAPVIAQAFELLSKSSVNAEITANLCEALDKHKLIKPWEVKLQREQGEQTLQGLFCIDEAALNQLSGKALKELRDAGALQTAYCQLLSMQHISALPQLAQAHANAAKKAADLNQTAGEVKLDGLEDDGSINFDNL